MSRSDTDPPWRVHRLVSPDVGAQVQMHSGPGTFETCDRCGAGYVVRDMDNRVSQGYGMNEVCNECLRWQVEAVLGRV